MAGLGGEGDLRHLLKLHRTEIAMAVDDVFPLLHGLADHDVVPEHVFKETLSQTEREGSHRAFHALLTWLLGRDAATVRDFWAVLFKDYNLERYTRLRPLRGAFPREVELGRQRRGRCLSTSPTAPALHRPQGKRKAPEERDGARAVQPSPRHVPSPGPLVKTRSVKKPEGVDAPRTPRAGALQAVATSVQRAVAVAGSEVPITRGAVEGILIKHVLEPGSSRMSSKAGDEPCAPATCEEPGARSRSRSLKPPARPKAPQSSGEPRLHPQGRLPVPTVHSQDPAPHQGAAALHILRGHPGHRQPRQHRGSRKPPATGSQGGLGRDPALGVPEHGTAPRRHPRTLHLMHRGRGGTAQHRPCTNSHRRGCARGAAQAPGHADTSAWHHTQTPPGNRRDTWKAQGTELAHEKVGAQNTSIKYQKKKEGKCI
ncbi:autoimmune regulator isoform X4 [Strix uralensis]|uniref:autoimmune regulator isoform X4 n=1 Tax=Strix uralensis TaxID=36305 RepID=UPI003DA3594E